MREVECVAGDDFVCVDKYNNGFLMEWNMKIFFLIGMLCSLFCFVGGVDALEELPSGYSARDGVKMEDLVTLFQRRVIDGKQNVGKSVREFLDEENVFFGPGCSNRLWLATLLVEQHCAYHGDIQKSKRSAEALVALFRAFIDFALRSICGDFDRLFDVNILELLYDSSLLPCDRLKDVLPELKKLTNPASGLQMAEALEIFDKISPNVQWNLELYAAAAEEEEEEEEGE
jgi:hypothetical protein